MVGMKSTSRACKLSCQWSLDCHLGRLILSSMRGTSLDMEYSGAIMAQSITSWFICDGRCRVDAIKAMGRRSARIIEIEDVDSGERFHGSSRRLQHLFQTVGSSRRRAV
jgi:hypothetical protein